MRILFVGPSLCGLLYPMLFLTQAFRVNGYEVLTTSGRQFVQEAAKAELAVSDAAPGLDLEADYHHHRTQREKSSIGIRTGNSLFFSKEMVDHLVELAGHWRPDLIIYSLLGVIGLLTTAKYDIPVVMQTVGFGHASWYIRGVTRSLTDAYRRHNVRATPCDMAWVDVAPPGMSILENDGKPVTPTQYVPHNDGTVREPQWERGPDHRRPLVSLGTVKPMVDSLDLIAWVMDSVSKVDVETTLHISANVRSGLRLLPSNVRLIDWIPMGVFLNGADGFIYHDGAGNTLTALHAGTPRIVFGQGTDCPVNTRIAVGRGCGIIPGGVGLSSNMINAFLNNRSPREVSGEVAVEIATQSHPGEVAKSLVTMVQKGQPLYSHDNHLPAPIQELCIYNNVGPECVGLSAE